MRQCRARSALAGWIALWLAVGCASPSQPGGDAPAGRESQSASRFPSARDLSKVAQAPAPEQVLGYEMRQVDSWLARGPLPKTATLAAKVPTSPWETLLAEVARPGTTRTALPASLHCLAREYARFYVETRANPTPALLFQLQGACGVLLVDPVPRVLSSPVPAAYPEARLFRDWRAPTSALIRSLVLQGKRELGIAYVRGKDFAVVAVVGATRRAEVEDLALEPGRDGRVRVRGRMLVPAAELSALVNQGPFDARECSFNPALRPPRFELSCEIDPDDKQTWIQLYATAPGRLLADEALSLWIRRKPRSSERLSIHPYLPAHVVGERESLSDAVLRAINQVRADAKRTPLEFERLQSREAASLALPYFAAQYQEGPKTELELIALGMMAGWQVPGTIRSGRFLSALGLATRDVGRWLSTALALPIARQCLLRPRARGVAIGAVGIPEIDGFGGIVASYSFFEDRDNEEARAQLLREIARKRAGRGLPPLGRNSELDYELEAAADRVRLGELTPEAALHSALRTSSTRLQRSIGGFVIEAGDADQVPIPESLLRPGTLEMGLAVSHYQPEGEAWGRFVVLFASVGTRGDQ